MDAFWAFWTSTFSNVIKPVSEAVITAGIIAGGIWTYFLFVRGRTLKPKIDAKVTGALSVIDGRHYLVVFLSVINRGGTVVEIDHRNTGVAVQRGTRTPSGAFDWLDEELYFARAFRGEKVIEPAVMTTDEIAFGLEVGPLIPLRVVFILQQLSRKAPRWVTNCIVLPLGEASERVKDGLPGRAN